MCARLACAAGALLLAVPAASAALPSCGSQRWVGAWAADPGDAAHDGFAGQTLREIVTPHMGGAAIRVHLTNRFGSGPVTFDAITLARRASGPAVVPGTVHPVTFGGRRSVVLAAGSDAVSDPIALQVAPFEDLAVSLYTSGATGPATEHYIARQTSYASAGGSGDHTRDALGGAFGTELSSWYFLSGVDVLTSAASGAVAAFGDSITDGFEGELLPVIVERRDGFDQNVRYPDFLARRLLATGTRLAVLNDGITGNRLLSDGLLPQFGPSGLSRLSADVLARAGVTTAIVLEGINDIQQSDASAEQLEAGYSEVVRRLRAAGVRVLLGTLSPAGSWTGGGDGGNAVRQAVNTWIRTSHAADGVVDFDAALRDPDHPDALSPRYDSGDHLHPNVAGYRRMADAVDLASLARPTCTPVRARAHRRRHHRRHRHHHRRASG